MNYLSEQNRNPGAFGLVARYETPGQLLKAVQRARLAGYQQLETYTPFPVAGIDELLEREERVIPWAVFIGGLIGGVGGFMMQYIANVWHYPLNIGGRPYNSWPAFVPISFELTILFAALSGFVALLIRCRLPQLYHPVFNAPGFEHASRDSFFLCILAQDKNFNLEQTKEWLKGSNPVSVDLVEY